jgi:response regulator RpfG family c-di-GMP phosphodiesterase
VRDAIRTDDLQDAANAEPRGILVVDDVEDIVESLKGLFESSFRGIVVHTATSGQRGLEILKQEPIDLIVADYRMPGMNGLDFLTECKRINDDAARVLITAFPDMELALRAINEAKLDNFFKKPLEPAVILEVVSGILYERRARELRERAFAHTLDLARRSAKPSR